MKYERLRYRVPARAGVRRALRHPVRVAARAHHRDVEDPHLYYTKL